MILIYCEIDVDKLYPGVSRPQKWWDKHPQFKAMQKRMIKSIKKGGLKYPLTAVNLHDDGTYEVTVGNQRLEALRDIGTKKVPCVVCNRPTMKHIPKGKILETEKDVFECFGGEKNIKHVCWNINTFSVMPNDTDEWNPDKFKPLKKKKRRGCAKCGGR